MIETPEQTRVYREVRGWIKYSYNIEGSGISPQKYQDALNCNDDWRYEAANGKSEGQIHQQLSGEYNPTRLEIHANLRLEREP